ncbi:MAG TPA: aminotransferase class IV, partial [Anaerolineales bacterium]
VLGLTAHLQRLYEPVLSPEVDDSFLRRQLFALLEPFRPGETRVRAMMTRHGQVYLAIMPLSSLPREVYQTGVRVETTDLHRESPHLKSTAFIAASDSERKHIAQEGVFEALLVQDGIILEGMTSNFFCVVGRDGILPSIRTARDDILLGVTRQTIIDIAQRSGLNVEYEPLEMDQLDGVSEAFITSSSRGIVPVVQIDEVTIGQGRPGPVTKQLSAGYEAYVLEQAEKIV